jgi:predicted RNA-binding Zn-ribbon protein involved in translation (DUF1610 family)
MHKRRISWVELAMMATLTFLLYTLMTVLEIPYVSPRRMEIDKQIPFKCKACGLVVMKTLGELRKIEIEDPMGMPMGPMVCSQCGKKELTQAVQCPECGEAFIYEIDSLQSNDRCPKCGVSYAEAWRRKYAKWKR